MTPEELKAKTDELIKNKKYDDCIKLCKKELKKNENNDVILNQLGLCHLSQATKSFTEALSINPKNKEARENFTRSVPSMPLQKWQPRLIIGLFIFSFYYVYKLLNLGVVAPTIINSYNNQFGIVTQLLFLVIFIGLFFLLDRFFDRLRDLLVILRINSIIVAFLVYWILFYGYNIQITQNPDLNPIITIFITVWLWLIIKEVFDEIYKGIASYSVKISENV